MGKIGKIEEGAKEAAKGATGDIAIGGAPKEGQDAFPANKDAVNLLVKGIKAIVAVVLKENEGNAEANKTREDENKTIGKLLGGKDNSTDSIAAASSASI